MFTPAKLQVLVTGVDAQVARDVVRLAVSGGAEVIAADASAADPTASTARLRLLPPTVVPPRADAA